MEHLGELSVARMVDLPFRLLRPRFLQLWLPATAMAVVASAPNQLAAAAMGAVDFTTDPMAALPAFGAMLVALPVMLVAYTLVTAVVFDAVWDLTEGRPIDFVESIRSLDASRIAVIGILFIGVGVGAGCCFVPGIALSVYLGLALPVAFVERRGIGEAFQRSLDLVRGGRNGAWWNDVAARALAMVVVSFVLQYALGSVVTLPQTFYAMKVGFDAAATGVPNPNAWGAIPWWLRIPTALGSGGVLALMLLYSSAASLLLYRYARERLEGTALETAIQDAQKP